MAKKPTIHFLFAEDDPLMVNLYKSAFEFAGYDLQIAHDGEEALQTLNAAAEKPAAVILDIMMPKMNGLDMLEKMKQTPALKDIPAIMLSNLTGDEHEGRARTLGAVAYFVKSNYTPKQVVEEVVKLVQK